HVAGVGDGVDAVGGVVVGSHPRGGVGEDDVDLAELAGEGRDGGAIADVEDAALDAGDGGPGGDRGDGGVDAAAVTSGEQDAILGRQAGGEPFDEGAAEPLVGAGDE